MDSRRSVYPRPLSASQAARSENILGRRKLRSGLGLRHPRGDLEHGSSKDSLSITHIMKSVWPMLGLRSRLCLTLALGCAAVHAACTPAFTWVFAKLLTTFYSPGDQTKKSLIYTMSILGIAFVDGTATYLLFYLSDAVAQAWAHALKVEAMRCILMQPREFFDREENSISRLAETLDHFAEEACNLPERFACIFLMLCVAIVWSLATFWQLSLVASACGPAIFAITKTYNMISSRWERLANEADDLFGQVVHETFVNIHTVRCLKLEAHFRQKYRLATNAAVNVDMKRALYSESVFGLNFAGVLFIAILLFWYGAILVSTDEYSVTQITETFLIFMLRVNQINYMAHYITQVNISRDAGGPASCASRACPRHRTTSLVQCVFKTAATLSSTR